jgi:predicted DNA-binding WGR domain protein
MPDIHLVRIDPARRMQRYYHIDVQPTLFDAIAVVREWGRIGRRGRLRSDLYASQEAAEQAFTRLSQAKLRRGYRVD